MILETFLIALVLCATMGVGFVLGSNAGYKRGWRDRSDYKAYQKIVDENRKR